MVSTATRRSGALMAMTVDGTFYLTLDVTIATLPDASTVCLSKRDESTSSARRECTCYATARQPLLTILVRISVTVTNPVTRSGARARDPTRRAWGDPVASEDF
jgi:hypothetical protein